MNQTEIGKFIARCRKEKKLTQAQLAEKLNITDRAVSKWETGKSMPDSSIMLELCAILGITVNELLSGEEISMESYEKRADENLIALKRKEEKSGKRNRMIAILFSGMLLAGMMICFICDLAISGGFTWSLIPAVSIVFAWAVLFPGIAWGRKGMLASLLSLSIFIFPYLSVLGRIIKVREVFSIGAATAAASVVFLWIAAAVFMRIGRTRKFTACGIILLSAVPFAFLINAILSKMTAEPMLDVWDAVTVLLLLTAASAFFIMAGKRRGSKEAH